jgi:hypothetical protein
MDIIFENKTDITKKVLTEFSKKTYKVYRKKYRISVLLAAIASAFLAIAEMVVQFKINYSQITKFIETNSLYLLMIGKQGLMLNKSCFTVGDANAFKSFIMSKCNNVF